MAQSIRGWKGLKFLNNRTISSKKGDYDCFVLMEWYNHSWLCAMCLLVETVSQVSDVASCWNFIFHKFFSIFSLRYWQILLRSMLQAALLVLVRPLRRHLRPSFTACFDPLFSELGVHTGDQWPWWELVYSFYCFSFTTSS